jgi:hypothetical protein
MPGMAFDKFTKDLHDLTAHYAGPQVAAATFWMAFTVFWVLGIGVVTGTVIFTAKFLFPFVSALPRIPLPALGNAALSFAIAIAVVAVAGAWLLNSFRQTRDAVVRVFASRYDELATRVEGLGKATDSRISELLGVFSDTSNRVRHLESHAASLPSTNEALAALHHRMLPIEVPPDDVRHGGNVDNWMLLQHLNTPQASSVGHGLAIEAASYGVDGGNQIDVKNVLERNIKDNRLRMLVSNDTMGRDPQYGVAKQLHVRYSCDGMTRDVTIPENAQLDIPQHGTVTG